MAGEQRFSKEPPPPPRGRRFDQDGDASRRTWLAGERTVLAWLRTGLTATAVALAVGKVVPDLRPGGETWPYIALGTGYAVFGVLLVVYGQRRGERVAAAIRAGEWLPADDRMMRAIAAIALVLGLATAVVIVAG